jgi:hypothetical protein
MGARELWLAGESSKQSVGARLKAPIFTRETLSDKMKGMNDLQNSVERVGPSGGGPWSWASAAIWLPGSLLFGVLAAWLAVDVQRYFAPLMIFPILVGVGVGVALVLFMRLGQVGNRPTILLGTTLAVVAAVVGQHYFLYLIEKQREVPSNSAIEKAKAALPELAAQLPAGPPENFPDYLKQKAKRGRSVYHFEAREGYAWALWAVEGLLTLVAALGVIMPAMRLSFCSRCRSWYRRTRAARFPAEAIKRIAGTLDVDISERVKSGRCRLLACSSGCGPTGCELIWEDLDGNTFYAQLWLDLATRNEVVKIFDETLCDKGVRGEEGVRGEG